MLGKIFTVCLMVSVSACLLRPQPTGNEKLAKAMSGLDALLKKWRVKSAEEMVAKVFAKHERSITANDYADLIKLFKSSDGAAAIAAFKKPVYDKIADVEQALMEYGKTKSASEKIRSLALHEFYKTSQSFEKTAEVYRQQYDKIINYDYTHLFKEGELHTLHSQLRLDYPASKMLEISTGKSLSRRMKGFGFPVRLTGSYSELLQANLRTNNIRDLVVLTNRQWDEWPEDEIKAISKILSESDLETEAYPLYNVFLMQRNGTPYADNVYMNVKNMLGATSFKEIDTLLSNIIDSTHDLARRVRSRAILFNKISLSRQEKIKLLDNSQLNLTMLSFSGEPLGRTPHLNTWAINMNASLIEIIENKNMLNAADLAMLQKKQKYIEEALFTIISASK